MRKQNKSTINESTINLGEKMKQLTDSRKKEIQKGNDFGLAINPKTRLFDTDVVEFTSINTKKEKGYQIKSPWFCFQKIERWVDDEDEE